MYNPFAPSNQLISTNHQEERVIPYVRKAEATLFETDLSAIYFFILSETSKSLLIQQKHIIFLKQ